MQRVSQPWMPMVRVCGVEAMDANGGYVVWRPWMPVVRVVVWRPWMPVVRVCGVEAMDASGKGVWCGGHGCQW